jgi:hypothetical protein
MSSDLLLRPVSRPSEASIRRSLYNHLLAMGPFGKGSLRKDGRTPNLDWDGRSLLRGNPVTVD